MNTQKELEELRDWKESSMKVWPDMQAIGKLLNVKLGASVHDKIIPGIMALQNRIRELERQMGFKDYRIAELEKALREFSTLDHVPESIPHHQEIKTQEQGREVPSTHSGATGGDDRDKDRGQATKDNMGKANR